MNEQDDAVERELEEARRVRDTSPMEVKPFGDKWPFETYPCATVHRDNLFGFLIDDDTMDIVDQNLDAVLERGPKKQMIEEYAMGSLPIIDPQDRKTLKEWYVDTVDKESFKTVQD